MKQKIKFIVMVFGLTTSILSSLKVSAGPHQLTMESEGGDTITC